jgi:adenylosuccinate lyase
MIPRYTRPEMAALWSDEARFEIWLEVETVALEGMVKLGLAPQASLDAVRAKGSFNTARVLQIEEEVKHDVIAFLTNVAESVGPDARFLHRGMTSSDLLDTTFAIQLKRSGALLLEDLDQLLEVVRARAEEHKHTPCIGRSHGIHAEPITFGLKVISWYAELRRHRERLRAAIHDVAVGKISGAVGTYASLPPEVEAHVMKTVGLRVDEVSTQIVSRDRHAVFFSALAALGSSIERFSVEIRHLQRTEVREVEERFKSGQKGSSAMPHKRNPVLTENLCGIARLLRSYAQAAFENVALWHERDISHSSVERVIAPDACTLCDFMLTRFRSVMSGLVVYPDQMLRNLELTRGLVHSGTLLITLVDAGVTREEAYRMVQRNAMETWAGGATFEERVRGDEAITKALSPQALNQVFDLKRHFQHVDLIFERALKARYDA